MKSTILLFIIAVSLFQVAGIQSQDLQIQRGHKTKTFKVGHLIKIEEPTMVFPECNSCVNTYVIGRLESFSQDTLRLRIKVQSIPATKNGEEIGIKSLVNKDKMEKDWPVFKIKATSVLGITKQGAKKWKPINDGDMIGGALMGAGLVILLVPSFSEGEENKDELVATGATISAIGLVTAAVFNRKTYYVDNPKNTKNKTWSIINTQ